MKRGPRAVALVAALTLAGASPARAAGPEAAGSEAPKAREYSYDYDLIDTASCARRPASSTSRCCRASSSVARGRRRT